MGNLRFCGDISVFTMSLREKKHRAYGFECLKLPTGERAFNLGARG